MDLMILSDSFGVFMVANQGLLKLKGFSKLLFKNECESYIRKYINEDGAGADIISAMPEISYTFDRMKNNQVHDELAEIADFSKTGDDCVKEFVLADFSGNHGGKVFAVKQKFVVKCSDKRPEDGFLDYSGVLLGVGVCQRGSLIQNNETFEFVPERGGVLCD